MFGGHPRERLSIDLDTEGSRAESKPHMDAPLAAEKHSSPSFVFPSIGVLIGTIYYTFLFFI